MGATNQRGRSTGTARLNQLCREVQGVILGRTVIETVGHGLDDPLKRLRGAGGAREWLRPEGVLVLGHQDNDPWIAAALDIPVPQKGEFIAVRVADVGQADATTDPTVTIGGRRWRRANDGDPVTPAPIVGR